VASSSPFKQRRPKPRFPNRVVTPLPRIRAVPGPSLAAAGDEVVARIPRKGNCAPVPFFFFASSPRGGREKKEENKTNVRTYFIWPGLDFCTRTIT
jgi:hypothetical protein